MSCYSPSRQFNYNATCSEQFEAVIECWHFDHTCTLLYKELLHTRGNTLSSSRAQLLRIFSIHNKLFPFTNKPSILNRRWYFNYSPWRLRDCFRHASLSGQETIQSRIPSYTDKKGHTRTPWLNVSTSSLFYRRITQLLRSNILKLCQSTIL